ncbi:MAG: hypothetical protein ACRCZ9_12190 [Fusobacteriaceae bacterium]
MKVRVPIVETLFDYTYGRDEFNQQQVLAGKDAKIHKFATLLFMEQGSIADNPNMGIDIESYRHRLNSPASISELRAIITKQSDDYMGRMITDVDVAVDQSNDAIVDIFVSIEKENVILKIDLNNPIVRVIYIDKKFEK